MKESGKSSRINKCPVSDKCGGCQYIDLSYDRQLKEKQRGVEKLLKPYGRVEQIIGMEEPAHYRNKVHAVFDFQKGRGIVSGTYQEGTHRVVPVEECLLEDQRADAIIASIELDMTKIQDTDCCVMCSSGWDIRRDRSWWCWYWAHRSCLPKRIL